MEKRKIPKAVSRWAYDYIYESLLADRILDLSSNYLPRRISRMRLNYVISDKEFVELLKLAKSPDVENQKVAHEILITHEDLWIRDACPYESPRPGSKEWREAREVKTRRSSTTEKSPKT